MFGTKMSSTPGIVQTGEDLGDDMVGSTGNRPKPLMELLER
jgi:hypothetical protein